MDKVNARVAVAVVAAACLVGMAVVSALEPEDWFTDIISVMGDVIDVLLADRTLAGAAFDCIPPGFIPGEIKFK